MLKWSKRWAVSFLILSYIFSQLIVIAFAWEIDKTAYVTSVKDGDSFNITGDKVRLADVDAPEWYETGGAVAKSALEALISGKIVYLDTDQLSGRDNYSRLVAVVYVKVNSTHYKNVNKALLKQGVVDLDDYSNNEFNPSSWNLYEIYTGLPLADPSVVWTRVKELPGPRLDPEGEIETGSKILIYSRVGDAETSAARARWRMCLNVVICCQPVVGLCQSVPRSSSSMSPCRMTHSSSCPLVADTYRCTACMCKRAYDKKRRSVFKRVFELMHPS